jgi:hypothetical protein
VAVAVAVAVAGATHDALIGGSTHVLGHLRLQELLDHSLDDLLQEAGIVQENPLRDLLCQPTMIFGHRYSVSEIG